MIQRGLAAKILHIGPVGNLTSSLLTWKQASILFGTVLGKHAKILNYSIYLRAVGGYFLKSL